MHQKITGLLPNQSSLNVVINPKIAGNNTVTKTLLRFNNL
jgi:hypothetical protein